MHMHIPIEVVAFFHPLFMRGLNNNSRYRYIHVIAVVFCDRGKKCILVLKAVAETYRRCRICDPRSREKAGYH